MAVNWMEKEVRQPFRFKPEPKFKPCPCYYSDDDFDPACPEHGKRNLSADETKTKSIGVSKPKSLVARPNK